MVYDAYGASIYARYIYASRDRYIYGAMILYICYIRRYYSRALRLLSGYSSLAIVPRVRTIRAAEPPTLTQRACAKNHAQWRLARFKRKNIYGAI